MPSFFSTFSSTLESRTVECISQFFRFSSCATAAAAFGSLPAEIESAISTSSECRRGFYDEFTVHLKFLVLRAFSDHAQSQDDARFVAAVRQCYPNEFHCARQIVEGLESRTQNRIPPEEQAYLAASLHRTCRLI